MEPKLDYVNKILIPELVTEYKRLLAIDPHHNLLDVLIIEGNKIKLSREKNQIPELMPFYDFDAFVNDDNQGLDSKSEHIKAKFVHYLSYLKIANISTRFEQGKPFGNIHRDLKELIKSNLNTLSDEPKREYQRELRNFYVVYAINSDLSASDISYPTLEQLVINRDKNISSPRYNSYYDQIERLFAEKKEKLFQIKKQSIKRSKAQFEQKQEQPLELIPFNDDS